jgi:cyclopropane fatty-acyl-phospholipid synthase-like methyltransferase
LGHTCTGIDFSPASIAYAREAANRDGLSCRYTLTDLRASDFGDNYDLVMLIFGEFNVFRVQHIQAIMEKAHAALNPDGILLLEPHTFEAVHQRGLSRPGWSSVEPGQGLFSDQAYIHLTESFWLEQEQAAITRHYIIDADQGDVAAHSETMLAYTETDYRQLLEACGFKDITFHPGLTGNPETADPHLCAITAYP